MVRMGFEEFHISFKDYIEMIQQHCIKEEENIDMIGG